MKDKIREYFLRNMLNNTSVQSYLRNNPDINEYIEGILYSIPEYISKYNVIDYLVNNKDLIKCKNCGKLLNVIQIKNISRRNGFQYCTECNKLPEIKTLIRKERLWKNKQTNMIRYGTDYPAQNDKIISKIKATNLKRYGTEFAINAESTKNKIKQTLIKNYGVDNISRINTWKIIKEYVKYDIQPLFSKDEYTGYNKDYCWKCTKCGNIFTQKIYKTYHISSAPYLPRCLNCYPFIQGYSNQEKELIEFCKQYYPNLLTNNRDLIKPLELDIVIPELKLAIEFNGDYWHSDKYKPSEYHLNKTIECEKIGYRLIHIFEHEWLNKQEIVKAKLRSILDKHQPSIYARNCVVKEISTKEKNEFLNLNHIQGEDKSKIKLGLYFKEQLVAVITFGKSRFNKKYEWELIRYSSSKHVLGGAGKLLKYFERNYKPKSLITYADRRFSQGNLYYKLGFNLEHISQPNFIWINNKREIKTRLSCQKHKIINQLNKNKTVDMIMIDNGYNKLYDCGNLVFTKIFN